MRQLLTVILGLTWSATVYADCAGAGLWIFPSGHTVKENPIFVLEGYAESQHVILGLNKKHSIYLKSGMRRVKLFVTEICVGQFHVTQAVLKPEAELEAGRQYTMFIENLPVYERFQRYNNATN